MMHPFSKILNDKSITNLMDAGLQQTYRDDQKMVRMKTGFELNENMSPAAMQTIDQGPRMKTIPRGNATSGNKTLLKNNSSGALLAGSSSLGRIGEVELGSMGLPREVS